MFPHTVTIYNKYKDGSTEKWQRTVLRGVFWDSSKGAITRKTGVSSADGLMMIVPMSLPGYKKPKEWADLEDKAGAWTLQGGDIAILGDISYEVVRSSKELLGYDDVLTITTVDTRNYGGDMAHFEVSGK
ncbi:hypothetical protein Ami103574_02565 [Aminipila butyrica]|uniref:Uncharacterized protein n=1 Tax=Aminipila butyrica TaxID=433296 RepID=A0A858BQZ5_9FIRM|nr:hypothetical protein [Aminipila butyrica]QIB68263.1 hypothetical protein Ami103574_02565 [Aminipila butyrica]